MKPIFQPLPLVAALTALLLTGCPQPNTPISADPDPSPEPSAAPVTGDVRLETDSMPRDSWLVGSPLTHERAGLSVGTFNGKIYAIGGDSEATIDLLDPVTDRWQTIQLPDYAGNPSQRSRSFGAAVAAWNRVFYIGGTVDWLQPQLDVYDPSAPHWLDAANPVTVHGAFSRISHAAVALDDELLVIGGLGDNGENQPMRTMKTVVGVHPSETANALDVYLRPDLPQARAGLGAARLESHVYAFGGFLSAPATGSAEATGSVLRFHTNAWHTTTPAGDPLATMNVTRHSFGSAVLDGVLYVAGGLASEGRALDSVEAYDPATNQWTLKAPMISPRTHLGLAAHGGRLYAIGGFDASGMPLRSVHVFRP